MQFSYNEIQTIKDSIEFRKSKLGNSLVHIQRLDSIINEINSPLSILKDRSRTLLSGCITEYAIYPTRELNQFSDYEILLYADKYKSEFEKMDNGFEILNRLMKRGKKKNSLFKTTVEKITKLTSPKTIYYSINSSENIYKIGIAIEKSLGLEIRLDGPSIANNFEIGSLSQQSFMKTGDPKQIFEIMQKNIEVYMKSQNLSIALTILQKASTIN